VPVDVAVCDNELDPVDVAVDVCVVISHPKNIPAAWSSSNVLMSSVNATQVPMLPLMSGVMKLPGWPQLTGA
jgi:hypothetical protein